MNCLCGCVQVRVCVGVCARAKRAVHELRVRSVGARATCLRACLRVHVRVHLHVCVWWCVCVACVCVCVWWGVYEWEGAGSANSYRL